MVGPDVEMRMPRIVIGLTGLAGSGKSTAANFLVQEHGFNRIAFARPLKAMARTLGFSEYEISAGKEEPFDWGSIPPRLAYPVAEKAVRHIGLQGADALPVIDDLRAWYAADRTGWKTPRIFLQRLGTEWGRERIHKGLWVNAWKAAVTASGDGRGDMLVVSDDCRFEDEAAAIRAMGGVVVRIEREGAGSSSGASHASEKGVKADITIRNDGTPEVLRARILGVLDRYFAAEAI